MHRRLLRLALTVTALAILGVLLLASTAFASTLSLKCGGKGPRNTDSAGTILCAAAPGKARPVAGTVRNDAGKPVAAKIAVTYISWTPTGDGSFTLQPASTQTIGADASGNFSLPVKTSTRVNVQFEVVADTALGVSAAGGEAQVSRRLDVRLKKLGGGKVKLSVKGAGKIPLKLYVLDSFGYEVSGVKPKKADRAGSATFDLRNLHGEFSYYVDSGEFNDLFWEEGRPTFKL